MNDSQHSLFLSDSVMNNNDNNNMPDEEEAEQPSSLKRQPRVDRTIVSAVLIAAVGAGVSTAFLTTGLSGAKRDQSLRFAKTANSVIRAMDAALDDYVGKTLWVHEACRSVSGAHSHWPTL